MPEHNYSLIPNDARPLKNPLSLWSRVTFGWDLSALDQQSEVSLAPGQRPAWWSSRNMRHAWLNCARAACLREEEPRLWRVVLTSVPLQDYLRLCSVLLSIVWFRILQVAFLGGLFYGNALLLYGSSVPWILFIAFGFWFSVCAEGFLRGHYCYFANLTSSSVKSGLTGLIYDKVLKLKDTALADFTHSHVLNLVSKDLQPIGQCVNLVPFLLTAPVELAFFCTFLTVEIGWECMMGILYMLLCTMLRCSMGRIYRKLRRNTAFFTDQRLRLLCEIISSIRAVKMNAWEQIFENLVGKRRRKEMSYIRRRTMILGAVLSIEQAVPIMSSLTSVATLLLRGKELVALNVFLIILSMKILHASWGGSFVRALEILFATLVRLKRVERFLLTDYPMESFFEPSHTEGDEPMESRTQPASPGHQQLWITPVSLHVSLHGVCCERQYGLSDTELIFINFSCNGNDLVAFTGPAKAGAGTSLLFDAVLQEVPLLRGQVKCAGKIAYAGQKPWIFSGTVRENILFGEPYREKHFLTVINACKLEKVLEVLPNGDLSIIGEHDVRLDLSQRQRISIARAAYSDATVVLLDSPLDHVDTTLANQIFEECIKGLLAQRLRLVITRRRELLEKCSRVLLMEDGVIVREETFPKNLEYREDLTWLLNNGAEECSDGEQLEVPDPDRDGSEATDETVGSCQYRRYLMQAEILPLLLLIGVPLIAAPGGVFAAIGFSVVKAVSTQEEEPREKQHQEMYIHVISLLVGAFLALLLARAFFLLALGLSCATRLHDRCLSALLKAPIHIFDSNFEDAIVRVFSKDMQCVDEKLPPAIVRFFQSVVEQIGLALIIKVAAPWTVLAALPAVVLTFCISKRFLCLSRSSRSLSTSSLKPLLAHLSDSIMGVVTIRAYQKQSHKLKAFYRLQNQYGAAELMRSAAEQWLAVRDLAITSVFMCLVTVIAIFTTNEAYAALLLIFDRELVLGIASVPVVFDEIQQHMYSASRLMGYSDVQPEPGYENGTKPPEDWPIEGAISMRNTLLSNTLRKRVSFQTMTLDVLAGEKICITGEIGSGKSSLVAALLRLPESLGEVVVDGISLKTLNLQQARKAFSVLQRKAFIFTASLRRNLDPEGKHKERELWNCLEAVKMASEVAQLPGQLDYFMIHPPVFSNGQLHLLSLARALLQKRKILILDRVLSNIDFSTFRKFQDVIAQELASCTVISVPNGVTSIDTVLCHDRVVIMEQGRIAEMGSPGDLLERQNSLLSSLLHYYRYR